MANVHTNEGFCGRLFGVTKTMLGLHQGERWPIGNSNQK